MQPAIPFNDLGRGVAQLRGAIDGAIARVLDSGWFVMGPEHNALESELSEYLGIARAVAVGNGTDALQLALAGLGVGAGDRVLTAANAGGYTSTAVRALGAQPVFADVDESDLQLSERTVREALDSADVAPRVIVVTHLFGAMGDVAAIVDLARARGIAVLEDCAQALGATRDGRRAGTFGDVATTSFYPTKNLGALGDGGAIVTDDPELATRLAQLRQYGWSSKYTATVPGGRNSRLDELQAAILRVKLTHLDDWSARRRAIHARYAAALTTGRLISSEGESFVGHLAVLDLDDREAARAALSAAGIGSDVHYPVPDHRQPVHSGAAVSLPVTERSAGRILSIPLFPELTDAEIDRVCEVLHGLG